MPKRPLLPRKQTSSAQERVGLKKQTFYVCFAPHSGRKWVGRGMSAFDPQRTLSLPFRRSVLLRSHDVSIHGDHVAVALEVFYWIKQGFAQKDESEVATDPPVD